MILDIVGASASWEDNKLHVAFDVVPEESSHIDLKTGEIFQSSSYAWLRKQEDKAISGTLVRRSTGAQCGRCGTSERNALCPRKR
jgi:hypothetical protein